MSKEIEKKWQSAHPHAESIEMVIKIMHVTTHHGIQQSINDYTYWIDTVSGCNGKLFKEIAEEEVRYYCSIPEKSRLEFCHYDKTKDMCIGAPLTDDYIITIKERSSVPRFIVVIRWMIMKNHE